MAAPREEEDRQAAALTAAVEAVPVHPAVQVDTVREGEAEAITVRRAVGIARDLTLLADTVRMPRM